MEARAMNLNLYGNDRVWQGYPDDWANSQIGDFIHVKFMGAGMVAKRRPPTTSYYFKFKDDDKILTLWNYQVWGRVFLTTGSCYLLKIIEKNPVGGIATVVVCYNTTGKCSYMPEEEPTSPKATNLGDLWPGA